MTEYRLARRITDMMLPERAVIAHPNVRAADLELMSHAPAGFMDTTHFDTERFPPPAWALELFQEAAGDGSLAYTGYRGHPDVLDDVAVKAGRFLGVELDPALNLILTPGTQAALFAALSAQVNPGDRVALFDPDYLFTARMLRFLGADVGYVPLSLNNGHYEPDLGALENEFARNGARYLVFSHPNNPTGSVYRKEVISDIAALAVRYDVSVVADELYARLVYDNTPFHHLTAEPGMFERTATLLGPSKTESLSGYRLGVVVGSDRLMKGIENVLSITSLRAPAYAQHVLKGWLGPDEVWLNELLSDFKALREQTVQAVRQLDWIKLHPQMGTAYLWPDVSALGLSDSVVGRELLEKAGVLISPGYQFGPTASGHFRLCYARDEKLWAVALEKVIAVLDNFAKRTGIGGR